MRTDREVEKPVFRSKGQRHQQPNRHHDHRPPRPSSAVSLDQDRHRKRNRESELRDKELEVIKQQYFGSKNPKKQAPKATAKSRFSPNWDNAEGTSRDFNTLYHISKPLFGRGLFGGIDKPLQKRIKDERHWSQKVFDELTERDWRIFKEDFGISYKGSSKIPYPMRNWGESKLSSQLLKAVEQAGYATPTPIQRAAIPLGVQQRDVIGIAETGSGKTAAFVLPMLNYISRLPSISETDECDGPYAVVLAPTRELALQIKKETDKFACYMGIKVTLVTGGRSYEKQGFKISQGCEIVVATPGRFLDCLERRYVVLNQCNYVVLDEADRMIDEGLEQQVVGVLDAMPSSNLKPENEDEELDERKVYRTTYMFSATMRPAVQRLARKYLRNPVVVTIGEAGKATDLIKQEVIMMQNSEKMHELQKLISGLGGERKVIVFVNTRESVDKLAKNLDIAGYRVITLHGRKSQEQRDLSLEGFKSNRYNILVATDVVGLGIDIPDVGHVINYDMPGDIEKYTHRIGRTGRAGRTGLSTTFLTKHDTNVFYDLKQLLIQSNSNVPPELTRHEASKFKPGTVLENPPRCRDTVFPRCGSNT